MDELLKIFLSWQFMIFCLGLAAVGFIMRKIVEYTVLDNPRMPGNKNSMIWRTLILPIAPVITGAVAGYLAKNYPYPDGLGASEYGRISFGLVAGLLSGLVYRVINEILKSKIAQGYAPSTTSQDMAQSIQVTMPLSQTTEAVVPNNTPVIPNTETMSSTENSSSDS